MIRCMILLTRPLACAVALAALCLIPGAGYGSTSTESDLVSVHFPEPTDIRDIIKAVSVWTDKKVVMDRQASGKVQIVSPTKVAPAEAYQIFVSALAAIGLTTVETGQVVRIVKRSGAARESLKVLRLNDFAPATDEMVTQVFRPKYIPAAQTRMMLGRLLGPNAMIAHEPTNTLIVSDSGNNLRRAARILDIIDLQAQQPELSTIPILNGAPKQIKKILEAMKGARGQSNQGVIQQFKIFADDASSRLFAFGPRKAAGALRAIVKELDAAPRDGGSTSRYHIRPVQFGDAKKLAAVLQQMRQSTGKKSDELKIVAHEPSNSLIVAGSKDGFIATDSVLRRLDVRRPQVFVEMDILDIQSDDAFSFMSSVIGGYANDDGKGTKIVAAWEGQAAAPMVLAGSSAGSSPASTSERREVASVFANEMTIALVPSKSVEIDGLGKINPAALLKLIKSDSKAKVLSQPYILTSDGEEATVSVGETIFFNTVDSSPFGTPVPKVEKENIDVSIRVLPKVSDTGYLSLRIELEASELAGLAHGGIPRVTKRKAAQKVIAKSGQIMMIAGLERRRELKLMRKVPVLGDIPLLGVFFRQQRAQTASSRLVVMLKAHTIHGTDDLLALYRQKAQGVLRDTPDASRIGDLAR